MISIEWTTPVRVGGGVNTAGVPAIAPFSGKLYLAYRGSGDDQQIWFSSTSQSNPGTWASCATANGDKYESAYGPTLLTLQNQLLMMWHGKNSDTRLFGAMMNQREAWDSHDGPFTGRSVHYTAGLSHIRGFLAMAHADASGQIMFSYATPANNWTELQWSLPYWLMNQNTSGGVAIAPLGTDRAVAMWMGMDSAPNAIGYAIGTATGLPNDPPILWDTPQTLSGSTVKYNVALAQATAGNTPVTVAVWRTNDSASALYWSAYNGNAWQTPQQIQGPACGTAPGMCLNPANGKLALVYKGTESSGYDMPVYFTQGTLSAPSVDVKKVGGQ